MTSINQCRFAEYPISALHTLIPRLADMMLRLNVSISFDSVSKDFKLYGPSADAVYKCVWYICDREPNYNFIHVDMGDGTAFPFITF